MSSSISPKRRLKRAFLQRGRRQATSRPTSPLVVAGMFRTANGIGEAARRFHDALVEGGFFHIPVDTRAVLNQVDFEPDIELHDMPRDSSGTILLIANPPEIESLLAVLRLWRWKSWKILSYWC